jgi:hypothetical protein
MTDKIKGSGKHPNSKKGRQARLDRIAAKGGAKVLAATIRMHPNDLKALGGGDIAKGKKKAKRICEKAIQDHLVN